MTEHCHNCNYTRYKLNELMEQYEELLKTKEDEIACSHRIIAELESELTQCKLSISGKDEQLRLLNKAKNKIITDHQDTTEYLKQREVKLLHQLRTTENEVFKLTIHTEDNQELIKEFDAKENEYKDFHTPQKVGVTNSGNITLCKEKENYTLDKIFQECSFGSDNKESIKLKVAEDKLQLMNIKYKMALLKTMEVATIK